MATAIVIHIHTSQGIKVIHSENSNNFNADLNAQIPTVIGGGQGWVVETSGSFNQRF